MLVDQIWIQHVNLVPERTDVTHGRDLVTLLLRKCDDFWLLALVLDEEFSALAGVGVFRLLHALFQVGLVGVNLNVAAVFY